MAAWKRSFLTCGVIAFLLHYVATTSAVAEMSREELTGGAVSGSGPYVTDVNTAISLFGSGDFSGALKRLEDAKKVTPILAPAEVMMAKLYLSANQLPPAYAMLEKAMQVAPTDPEPAIMLIERALPENRFTEASLLASQAEKLLASFSENPRRKKDLQVRLYLSEASIELARQNLDVSQAKLEALTKLDPSNAVAHQRLGQVLFEKYEKGDAASEERAFEAFKQAANADPAALPADLMMAMLSKDPVKSAKWVAYAIEHSPNDRRTQVGAANYFLKEGQLAKAQQHAAQAVKLDGNGFEANLLAGIAAQAAADFPQAVEYLSRAHLAQPANPAAVNQLALALLETPGDDNHDRALKFAQLNARNFPDNLDAMTTLGWINFRLNRMVDADRAFNVVLGARSVNGRLNVNSDSTFILAYLAAKQGNREDAARLLQSILDRKQIFAYRPKAEELLAHTLKGSPQPAAIQPAKKP
jgi:Tfp pilus assembly protein PilF